MKLTSPAKLNLILKVIDKLPNNYHLLEMFNVLIDLEDIIEINESNITKVQYDKYKMNTEEDTIYKTIKAFVNKYNLPEQSIYIIKNIPVGSGLGGVSSNIATIINYLNLYYNLGLTTEELINFVLPYGTDICFLLYNKKAIVKGIGEIVEPIDYHISQHVLLINPNIKIETNYIYNKVKSYSNKILNKEYIRNNNIDKILENDLEKVVLENVEEMKNIYNILKTEFKDVHMSGSGSTFFVLVDKEIDLDYLKNKYPNYLIKLCNIYN